MYFCHEPKSLFSILEGKMRERERERLGDRERERDLWLSLSAFYKIPKLYGSIKNVFDVEFYLPDHFSFNFVLTLRGKK